MKQKRQEAILEIITKSPVETQEALIEQLGEHGFTCTQSTVSRDIKELHLIKEPSTGGLYRYTVSRKKLEFDSAGRLKRIMNECCISCDFAGNIVVLKTMPGLASAAGAALDMAEAPSMVGCVCGDDTVMIVVRDESSAKELCREINLVCK